MAAKAPLSNSRPPARSRYPKKRLGKKLLAEMIVHLKVSSLSSDEHFTVDATRVHTSASMKVLVLQAHYFQRSN